MPDLVSPTPSNMDGNQNQKFYKLLGILFVIFVLVGMGIGVVVNRYMVASTPVQEPATEVAKEDLFEGTITFIDPNLNLADEISFVLVDKNGEDVILLKAKDKKLEVAEGHYATVYGSKRTTVDKKSYLLVDRIVIKNVAN